MAAATKRLWNFFDGEPYLDNPRLFILNPEKKRRKKKMARRVARRRSIRHSVRRRRSTSRRRSFRANSFVPNPRRRRRTYRRHAVRRGRRRSFRSNPFSLGSGGNILGFPIKQVMLAGGAVVAAPYIEHQLLKLMPVSMSATASGRWAGKIGAAVATGYIAKLAMGNEAARLAYIVLGANLVADAVAEFMPSGTGYMTNGMGQFTAGPSGFITSGPRANGNTYQGVSALMVAPNAAARDPYASVY